MYSKQLLEDVNKIVNPAFVKAINFDKFNEAIEKNQLIDLDLLTEGAKAETSIKKSLMRILGTKVIPAVVLGSVLLATSACEKKGTPQNDTQETPCFTPKAMKEITDYEKDLFSKVPQKDREFFDISSAKPTLYKNQPVFQLYKYKNQPLFPFFESQGKTYLDLATVKSKGGVYQALLNTYDKNNPFLIVPHFGPERWNKSKKRYEKIEIIVYILSKKKHPRSNGDANTAWTLVAKEEKICPIIREGLSYLYFLLKRTRNSFYSTDGLHRLKANEKSLEHFLNLVMHP